MPGDTPLHYQKLLQLGIERKNILAKNLGREFHLAGVISFQKIKLRRWYSLGDTLVRGNPRFPNHREEKW
jgi:hypothetical protein